MSISHLLEDFGAFAQGDLVEMTDVLLEEQRLEAFEKGYQAGWDDSAKATTSTAGHVSMELAQAIADLAMTYEEAYAGLLNGIHPLISQIIRMVLPTMAEQALVPRLSELIMQLVAENGRSTVAIAVSPGQASALRAMGPPAADITVTIEEDPTLSPDQVRLQIGDTIEQELDLTRTIAEITDAIDAFFNTGSAEDQRIPA